MLFLNRPLVSMANFRVRCRKGELNIFPSVAPKLVGNVGVIKLRKCLKEFFYLLN